MKIQVGLDLVFQLVVIIWSSFFMLQNLKDSGENEQI